MANRAARGSGSVRKRSKAMYIRYRPRGQSRQIEEVVPRLEGETMAAYRKRAEAELAKVTLGLASGTRNAPTQRTVEELAESYLSLVRLEVKPRTLETYEARINGYVLPALGREKVADLSTAVIRRFQQSLLSREVSGHKLMAVSTAREIMARLHDLIRFALDGADSREYWGVSFDPWPQRRFKWEKVERERPAPCTYAPYSVAEMRQYLTATPEHLRPHVLSIVCLMLRDGEFRGMTWAHLDEQRAVYSVCEQQSRAFGMGTTKTESSEAEVPVPRVLLDALNDHKKRQAAMRLKKGDKWQDHGLIFTTSKGTALPHWQMSQRWHREIVKAAGLRYVSLHTLRKTGSTILEAQIGVSRQEVMAALRHKRQTVTDAYVAYNVEHRREHIEQLADLLTDGLPACPQLALKVG